MAFYQKNQSMMANNQNIRAKMCPIHKTGDTAEYKMLQPFLFALIVKPENATAVVMVAVAVHTICRFAPCRCVNLSKQIYMETREGHTWFTVMQPSYPNYDPCRGNCIFCSLATWPVSPGLLLFPCARGFGNTPPPPPRLSLGGMGWGGS